MPQFFLSIHVCLQEMHVLAGFLKIPNELSAYKLNKYFIAEKLAKLYELVEKDYAVLVFSTCCSGKMLQPDSRKDILFIPMDDKENGWKNKVKDYRQFYLEKRKNFDPTADVLCNVFDPFSDNRNGALLIKELDVYEWVVFGNGLDFCVDNAVKSL